MTHVPSQSIWESKKLLHKILCGDVSDYNFNAMLCPRWSTESTHGCQRLSRHLSEAFLLKRGFTQPIRRSFSTHSTTTTCYLSSTRNTRIESNSISRAYLPLCGSSPPPTLPTPSPTLRRTTRTCRRRCQVKMIGRPTDLPSPSQQGEW